jgi:hypothetical protein
MLGAIIGDTVGSVYEFKNIKQQSLICSLRIVIILMIV